MKPGFLEDDFGTEVDLTPLIDVVFMLLLFFILASTFSLPVMQVALPPADTAEAVADDTQRLVLVIDAAGLLYHHQKVISVEEVSGLIVTHGEGPVELRVDRAAAFEGFVAVMDRLRAEGRQDVLITATGD